MRNAKCLVALILSLALAPSALPQSSAGRVTDAQLLSIRKYIKESWHTLERSNKQLAVAAVDPKFASPGLTRWPVYISRQENISVIDQRLRAQMTEGDLARIEVRQLPPEGQAVAEPGLLYLPYPYIVPGGRFNEMYGWDSYFIQVGLLEDSEIELALDVVNDFLFEIQDYGRILNANRTYYLSRSQPPFLTEMVLGVYRQTHDIAWLAKSVPLIEKYYRYWLEAPHFVPATGLSRYYDLGHGPAPEVLAGERDQSGKTHYDLVRDYYRRHEVTEYDVSQYYDRRKDELTDLFYIGDRSMRESGFDPSNRFGPFSIDITNYNPVCLNSLLYRMESETADILDTLHRSDARIWRARAAKRRTSINHLMWDEKDGLYFDYNFARKRVSRYPFATTFYPLWAGIATQKQAARVAANLSSFERAGGLLTSTRVSGSQWDAPYGWAPLEMIAVDGLRRYGYNEEADRISIKFLSMILKEFIEHNTIVEKYDVERRTSQLSAGLKFGYKSNEIGFGWTNAAFTRLYNELPERKKAAVLNLNGAN